MSCPIRAILNDVQDPNEHVTASPIIKQEPVEDPTMSPTYQGVKRNAADARLITKSLASLQSSQLREDSKRARGHEANVNRADHLTQDEDRISSRKHLHDRRSIENAPFHIFTAMLNTGELVFDLANQLALDDLVSLYAISRDFHERMNAHFTTMILTQAERVAPESAKIFRFKAYRDLCQPDPAGRALSQSDTIRSIPSFRWLRMIFFREKVVKEIIALMAEEGHRLPPRVSVTLKIMWLTMDFPLNIPRIGLLQNKGLWTDEDLYMAMLFIIKLDMRFTDPVEGTGGEHRLRELLLGQRSLSTLWKTLKRTALRKQIDVLRMFVRYNYVPGPGDEECSIFGIPPDQIGKGCRERFGKGQAVLLRPDELVLRESVRRGLQLEQHFVNMMLWGYIDPVTGENIEVTEEETMYEGKEEWEKLDETPYANLWEALAHCSGSHADL